MSHSFFVRLRLNYIRHKFDPRYTKVDCIFHYAVCNLQCAICTDDLHIITFYNTVWNDIKYFIIIAILK